MAVISVTETPLPILFGGASLIADWNLLLSSKPDSILPVFIIGVSTACHGLREIFESLDLAGLFSRLGSRFLLSSVLASTDSWTRFYFWFGGTVS